jgi:hypothetical protein
VKAGSAAISAAVELRSSSNILDSLAFLRIDEAAATDAGQATPVAPAPLSVNGNLIARRFAVYPRPWFFN